MMKKAFVFSDQTVYAYGYDDFSIAGEQPEVVELNDVPDELFFDALTNPRLYALDKESRKVQRNKKKRTENDVPPGITMQRVFGGKNKQNDVKSTQPQGEQNG